MLCCCMGFCEQRNQVYLAAGFAAKICACLSGLAGHGPRLGILVRTGGNLRGSSSARVEQARGLIHNDHACRALDGGAIAIRVAAPLESSGDSPISAAPMRAAHGVALDMLRTHPRGPAHTLR